ADMSNMFRSASVFNQDISGWDVARVTNMNNMFTFASAFNQDISGWNVASVTDMFGMFTGANAFSQNLGRWYVDETVDDLQTANSNYDGVNDLNVLNFNFVAQNAFLSDQSPSYALAASGVDNASFTLDSNTLSFRSDTAADGTYTVRIAVSGGFGNSNSIELTFVVDGTTVINTDDFITVWQMPADNLTLTFPGEGSYNINWGDGTTEDITDYPTHTYDTAGNYTVTAENAITRFNLSDDDDAGKLIDIQQWGSANWTSMEGAFYGASAMTMSASDSPDLASVANMDSMFRSTSVFNQDISSWNVASVTNMASMFRSASVFNQDISGWNIAGVTNMSAMFVGANAFSQNLGRWYVDETVDNLQTANADYNGVDNLNVLDFNFVAQNAFLSGHDPIYSLATDTAAEGSDNAIFTLESNTLNFINAGEAAYGTYTIRIAIDGVSSGGFFGPEFFGSSNSIELTVVVDASPTVTSIVRTTPTEETTSVDTLIWTVTFSENVQNVDASDFTLSGTTATLTVDGTDSDAVYQLTVTGGDLAELNDTVTLAFADGQNIEDLAGNALTDTTPTGDNQPSYTLDNTAPTIESIVRTTPAAELTNADTLTWTVTFSDTVTGVDAADFMIDGATVTSTVSGSDAVYLVTVTGGDLAALNGTVTLAFASTQNIADTAGNTLTTTAPTTNEISYTLDTTAPTITSIARTTPTDATTNADSLTWTVIFSDTVTAVDATDFMIDGTAVTPTVTPVTDSDVAYLVTVTDGDLAGLNGTVTLAFASAQNIADTAGNPLADTTPTGDNEPSYTLDNIVPTVTAIAGTDGTYTTDAN
ncbi:MAG: BspA family leucine-rich repeat surface protein, partial [Methylococcales symbiont of Iophon sp. n. MRB-2018]